MTSVIQFEDLTGMARFADPTVKSGAYLESYDPEAHRGQGKAKWTDDIAKAMRFATQLEAFDFWRQQSKTMPFRPDGKPNRPLTAFTISVGHIDDPV